MENRNAPAYPKPVGQLNDKNLGLTKREYFAGLAMQGLAANPDLQMGI